MAHKASITYCGHSTVLLTTEKQKQIMIDPWLDGNPSCPSDLANNLPKVDYVLLTHGHSDHTASVIDLAKRFSSTIVATWELANLLIKDGVPASNVVPMNKGGTAELPGSGGLFVSLTQAFHSSSYDARDGHTYYAGEPCGIVVRLESGRTVYHAGDTLLFSDMSLIHEEFRPEVALLPIGDRFTMNPKAAAKATALIRPRVAIPIHYATFPLLTGSAEEFKSETSTLDCETVVLKPGASYTF